MSTDIMSSEKLREELASRVAEDHAAKGLTLRPEVRAALRAVPRELYMPGVPLEQAYANEAVVTKRRGEEAVSSVSAPFLIAEMLGQAADRSTASKAVTCWKSARVATTLPCCG